MIIRTPKQIIEQLEYMRKIDTIDYFEWCDILDIDKDIYAEWVFDIETPNDYNLIIRLNSFLEKKLYNHGKINGYLLDPDTTERTYLSFENIEDFANYSAITLYNYPGYAVIQI